ncbi:MAG: TatD family hydrolase, partial [Candidatus Micrarchaeaceae archaeon]
APPLDTKKRAEAIRDFPLELLMAETDSPVIGKAPYDVIKSIEFITAAKGLRYEETARAITFNTNKFFGLGQRKPSEKNIRL